MGKHRALSRVIIPSIRLVPSRSAGPVLARLTKTSHWLTCPIPAAGPSALNYNSSYPASVLGPLSVASALERGVTHRHSSHVSGRILAIFPNPDGIVIGHSGPSQRGCKVQAGWSGLTAELKLPGAWPVAARQSQHSAFRVVYHGWQGCNLIPGIIVQAAQTGA